MNWKWGSRFLLMLGFTLVVSVTFALPSLAMGKGTGETGVTGGTGGTVGTGGASDTLHVSCIEWATTGGRNQHIHVQAFVVDQDGNPVLDAVVSMSAIRDEVEYAVVGGPTRDYEGLDGGVSCPEGHSGLGFTRDFCVNKAPAGFYKAVVLSVTKDGFTWDEATPLNGVDYQGKQQGGRKGKGKGKGPASP